MKRAIFVFSLFVLFIISCRCKVREYKFLKEKTTYNFRMESGLLSPYPSYFKRKYANQWKIKLIFGTYYVPYNIIEEEELKKGNFSSFCCFYIFQNILNGQKRIYNTSDISEYEYISYIENKEK